MKRGTIIVLSGPSGAGKSTLVGEVLKVMPDLNFSISCTTRKPRGAEKHGVEYYFLSEEEFVERIHAGEFVEHAQVHANRYGTLKSEVLNRISRGADVLLDIDVQGALQIRAAAENDPELKKVCEFVFVGPPAVEVLETRLRGRATESEEQILLRLAKAKEELSHWRDYDYLVINDDLETAVADFAALIRAFRLKSSRMNGGRFDD